MVIAVLNENTIIIGIGYLRCKSAIENFRRLMSNVEHVQMYLSHDEWIPEGNEWIQASITYEFVHVPYDDLDDTFSMAMNYARNINKPTLIVIENKIV